MVIVLGGVVGGSACSRLRIYETPAGVGAWQDIRPPGNSLAERADAFQAKVLRYHRTPSGVLRYRRQVLEPPADSYGDLADGCFHTGIYLASQVLRFRATGSPEAREEFLHALSGLEVLMAVTGKRGLLARHISPLSSKAALRAEKWRHSPTLPDYVWRGDASKDQYAGFIHGLGVALALVADEDDIRRRVAALATAAADHLMENGLRIVGGDGRPTTYGDLRGRFLGFPKGVDALICLAIAKVAAESSRDGRYEAFYQDLVKRRYPQLTYAAYLPGVTKRVNDHMGYLALYPLLLLEGDREISEVLRRGARRSWRQVSEERNAFFAFIQAAVVGADRGGDPATSPRDVRAEGRGRAALAEFPANKVEWPVDLTRPGFGFRLTFLNDGSGYPRSRDSVPLYLRVRGSSLWVGDPYRVVGRLTRKGEFENAGVDYLVAYWMGRHHGFIASDA